MKELEMARECVRFWTWAQEVCEKADLLENVADCAWWRVEWEELLECLERRESLIA